MALTQTAEYALRAVVWLAQHPADPQTKQQIADATQVPASYLPKVLQPLVRGDWIRAQRGVGGGYSLGKKPDSIWLIDIVDAVDPIHPIETCPLSLETHGTKLCPLHSLLNKAIQAERMHLSKSRISDVIRPPGELTPLCEIAAAFHENADADTKEK